MIIPLTLRFKIRPNDWQRYKPNGSGNGPAAMMELQVKAAQAATQALADELGISVERVELIMPPIEDPQ